MALVDRRGNQQTSSTQIQTNVSIGYGMLGNSTSLRSQITLLSPLPIVGSVQGISELERDISDFHCP